MVKIQQKKGSWDWIAKYPHIWGFVSTHSQWGPSYLSGVDLCAMVLTYMNWKDEKIVHIFYYYMSLVIWKCQRHFFQFANV